jgi:Xaa-Pro aminopeptidase
MQNGAVAKEGKDNLKNLRRSISLPVEIIEQIGSMARHRGVSENRVLVDLVLAGLEAEEKKQEAFFELAEQFRAAKTPEEVTRWSDRLSRFVFGE